LPRTSPLPCASSATLNMLLLIALPRSTGLLQRVPLVVEYSNRWYMGREFLLSMKTCVTPPGSLSIVTQVPRTLLALFGTTCALPKLVPLKNLTTRCSLPPVWTVSSALPDIPSRDSPEILATRR
jgi:hypothetical protein